MAPAPVWKLKEGEYIEACSELGLPVEVDYAPFQNNVPEAEMDGGKPKGLTDHGTGNFKAGADARAQQNWVEKWHGGGPPNLASFTKSVDDKRVVVICRLNYRNYHAGIDRGNRTHGSMEICEDLSMDRAKVNDNAAKANAAFLYIWKLGTPDLVQHNYWYGKDCPYLLRRNGWGQLVTATDNYLRKLKGAQPAPLPTNVREFPTKHLLYGEFRTYFEAHGDVPAFGFPVTDTTAERIKGKVYPYVQWFERARFEWHPEVQGGRVLLGLVGVELLLAKGRKPVPEQVTIAPRFKAYWEQNGGIDIFGVPIEGERLEAVEGLPRLVQYFERARLEFNQLTGAIERGRVAAEARDSMVASVAERPAFAA